MDHYLFTQLDFVRNRTITVAKTISEEKANVVPEGFKNNIRWHLGHIYFVQEKFAFGSLNLPTELPEAYSNYFAPGTSPLSWDENLPTMTELIDLLKRQQERINETLKGRLEEEVPKPIRLKSGLELTKVAEFLSFNLFHEGGHLASINNFLKLIK